MCTGEKKKLGFFREDIRIPAGEKTIFGVLYRPEKEGIYPAVLHDFDAFDHIGSFDKEVLIIHGDRDEIVPLSYQLRAQKVYKRAELVILPEEGHGFSEAGSVEALELAGRFLRNKSR